MIRPFYTLERTPVPNEQEEGGVLWMFRSRYKYLPPPGFGILVVRSVVAIETTLFPIGCIFYVVGIDYPLDEPGCQKLFTAFAPPMHAFSDEVPWSLLGFGPASRPHATEQTGP